MDIGVHVSFTSMVFPGYIPRSMIAEPYGLAAAAVAKYFSRVWLYGLEEQANLALEYGMKQGKGS